MEAGRPRAQPLTRGTIAALAGLLVVAVIFAPRATRKMRDFEVYWTAAGRALQAAPLYRAEDGSLCLFSLVVPAGSQTPAVGRHSVADDWNASAGQFAAEPVQVSCTSHTPADVRQT